MKINKRKKVSAQRERSHRQKKWKWSVGTQISLLLLFILLISLPLFIFSLQKQTRTKQFAIACGNPAHQGQCVAVGSCHCPAGNTLGPGGVCGTTLECCTDNYPGNANNCPGTGNPPAAPGGAVGGGTGGVGAPVGGGVGIIAPPPPPPPQTCSFQDGAGKTYNGMCQRNDATCAPGFTFPNLIAVGDPKAGSTQYPSCSNNVLCCPPFNNVNPPLASVKVHLNGTGVGANADGSPENANPQATTVTAQVAAYPITVNTKQANTGTINASAIVQATAAQGTGGTGTLTYDTKIGNYSNAVFTLPAGLNAGTYYLYMHIEKYLNQQLTQPNRIAVITIPPATDQKKPLIDTALVTMLPGDIIPNPDGDNYIDIQDYNLLIGCLGATISTGTCPDPKRADLNSDGKVDEIDLQLLLDHFGSIGASPTTPKFICEQDPGCKSSLKTLQFCPLICKIEQVKL
jgi:Dockerin type I domain